MLKSIRKSPLINKVVRSFILKGSRIFLAAKRGWRISGTTDMQVLGHRFQLTPKCDDGVADLLFYDLDYIESSDLNAFIGFVKPNAVILDIGANTGVYSVLSATIAPTSHIYAFEPNPVNMVRLKENLELNNLSHAKPIPMAVGAENTEVVLNVPVDAVISDTTSVSEKNSVGSYGGSIEWKKIKVKQTTVDSFCEEHQTGKVDLIKIDVEGYEIPVLKGALKTIQSDKPVILFESFHDLHELADTQTVFQENGYFVYHIFKEGIVNIGQSFEPKPGLNFLLLPFATKNAFTPMNEIGSLVNG